jgi:hypothetical protein
MSSLEAESAYIRSAAGLLRTQSPTRLVMTFRNSMIASREGLDERPPETAVTSVESAAVCRSTISENTSSGRSCAAETYCGGKARVFQLVEMMFSNRN